MGEFRQMSYANQGTEIEFMQGFVDFICGLWEGTTCEDAEGNEVTMAELYADTTATPQFYLNFGGGIRLEVHRYAAVSTATNIWVVNARYVQFMSQSTGYNIQATRAFNLIYIVSSDFLWCILGGFNSSGFNTYSCTLINFQRNNVIYNSVISGSSPSNAQFYGNDNSSVYLQQIFNFTSGAGQIDYSLKTPMCVSGVKVFDIEYICSCSNVTAGTSFALPNGKNYYAIGTNWMVEVDPPT